MRCASCQQDNPPGFRFCGHCRQLLPSACPSCKTELPVGYALRFCGYCGGALPGAEPIPPIESAMPSLPTTTVESITGTFTVLTEQLRTVTVLFCDLVGSVALAERLDPEELRDVVQSYQRVCSEAVERYGGHVAQLLGDGLMAYFGFPTALEQDPQRAARAGLDIIPAVAALGTKVAARHGVGLQVRVGIHTGRGIATAMGETRETLVVGQVSNIAARIQAIAEPGMVAVSAKTFPLLRGLFDCQSLGQHDLKGIPKPIEVFRVLRWRGFVSPFEVERVEGLRPLVGRLGDAESLERCFDRATEGRGQVVAVVGEAGIGKSRLVQHLRDRAAGRVDCWLDGRCSPFQTHSALAPIVELLQGLFELRSDESIDTTIARLEKGLRPFGLIGEEVPLLASMLGLPITDRFPALELSAQRQKERTLETLVSLVVAMAEKGPVIFFLEDLHWVDPSTLELLGMLVSQVPTTRLLILLTLRPDMALPWAGRPYANQITLDRLSDEEIERLILERTGGRSLPPEVLRQLIAKTDGVPLFVEELTRMVLDSGLLRPVNGHFELDGPLPPLAIPDTLQDSLMARLDRLAAVRELVQLAAAIGREFSFDMMRAVASQPDPELRQGLDQLVDAEILYKRGVTGAITYSFRHALIQDAAYESLLKGTRQQYHLRIARTIEEKFPDLAEGRPELIAQHWSAAGLAERAITYWLSAGRRAVERSANLEAIGHLERALALSETLAAGPPRDRAELDLRTMLGPALIATRGYAAPEVEANYDRARELCTQVGEAPQLFWVLRGLWAFHLVRCSFETALEFARRMTEIALGRKDRALQFEAHLCAGMPQLFLGDFALALAEFEAGLALDSPARDRTPTFITGLDVAVTTLAISGVALWHLGRPGEAAERCAAAIRVARDVIAHPFSLADALSTAAWVHQLRNEPGRVAELAENLLDLSTEKGFTSVDLGNLQLGWAFVRSGDPERGDEGLRRIQHGLAAYRSSGARLTEIYFLSLLTDAYLHLGRRDDALRTFAEARALSDQLVPRAFWRAHLLCLEAELAAADPGLAERLYIEALKVARAQGAPGLVERVERGLATLQATLET